MGKRQTHGVTHWTCDWTGVPMQSQFAFLPQFTPREGKTPLMKRTGSYATWECALAHLYQNEMDKLKKEVEEGELEEHWRDEWKENASAGFHAAEQYMQSVTDTMLEPADHWNTLEHFGGYQTVQNYFDESTRQCHEAVAIRILPEGGPHEVLLDLPDWKAHLPTTYIPPKGPTPPDYPWEAPTVVNVARKGLKPLHTLTVYHWTPEQLLHPKRNTIASAAFKIEMFGPVLVVLSTKELSLPKRERILNYNLATFNEHYGKRRVRKDATGAPTINDYREIKRDMAAQLKKKEMELSQDAVKPGDMMNCMKLPPANGKDLADLGRHLQQKRKLTEMVEDPSSSRGSSSELEEEPPPAPKKQYCVVSRDYAVPAARMSA